MQPPEVIQQGITTLLQEAGTACEISLSGKNIIVYVGRLVDFSVNELESIGLEALGDPSGVFAIAVDDEGAFLGIIQLPLDQMRLTCSDNQIHWDQRAEIAGTAFLNRLTEALPPFVE